MGIILFFVSMKKCTGLWKYFSGVTDSHQKKQWVGAFLQRDHQYYNIRKNFWITLNFRYTKLGYAGNTEPQFIIPSSIAVKESAKIGDQAARRLGRGVDDLDFFIGDEALDATGYAVKVITAAFCQLL